MTVAAPIIRPAVAERGSDGESRNSSTANEPTISAMASKSAMIRCSIMICSGSNRTGAAARVAPQAGRR